VDDAAKLASGVTMRKLNQPRKVTDQQWAIFRTKMEEIAGSNVRSPQAAMSPVEMAEMVLLLMDRIDYLEKRIGDAS
jgi:hypothetical protein